MNRYIHNLGDLFRAVVDQHPDRVALSFTDGSQFTFAEVDRASDKFARRLRRAGLKKYDVCAIAGVKKPHTYPLFIACLKLGITYTFFDPESPAERLLKIFRQCSPELVAGYLDEVAAGIAGWTYPLLDLADAGAGDEGASAMYELEIADIEGNTPAYIMFTSGSTGFPKGAVMTHDNLINFTRWAQATYGIEPSDIHTNINPLYFDNSVFDLYASLYNGASLVAIDKKEAIHPGVLLKILEQKQCTTWFSVPSMLIYLQTSKAIIPDKWRYIKKIIFGGEGYPKARLAQLYGALKHSSSIHNVYGPTECTCICSSYRVTDRDFDDLNGFLPLGEMAPNFSWQIVDEQLNHSDTKGELLLGGPNVGLGYYNDPERTRERFIQNPVHNNYRDLLYRTGDLVSWNKTDNKIYIHGRTDNQVKHMGYRIELEEIENALCQVAGVNEAAVFIVEASNNNKIIAVVQCEEGVDTACVKEELKKLVPSYMMPSEISQVERILKNANGKTDRLELSKKYVQWPK